MLGVRQHVCGMLQWHENEKKVRLQTPQSAILQQQQHEKGRQNVNDRQHGYQVHFGR